MRALRHCAVLLAALGAGCSGAGPLGEGTYPAELFLGVGQRQSSLSLDECTSTQLGAYLRFDGDAPSVGDYAPIARFVSSDPSIAFVGDGATPSPDGNVLAAGQLVALKPGLATISASYLSFSATLVVQVEALSDLRIEPALTDIAEDLPQKFDLIARFSQARPEQDTSAIAQWSFEPGTARAAVDAGGEVQANSARDTDPVTLVARLPECGRSARRAFRVSPIASVSLDYEFPDEPRLPLGTSEALRLYAQFAQPGATRQNISRSARIENLPDDHLAASVVTNTEPTSLAQALNPMDIGDDLVLVTALEDERADVAFGLHVDSGAGFDLATRGWRLVDTPLQTLAVTPDPLRLRYPDRRALRAVGTFANGLQRTLSREVAWTSLAPAVLSVSNQIDDAGTVDAMNVDLDAEVEARIDRDGNTHTARALVHIFSSASTTPSSDP